MLWSAGPASFSASRIQHPLDRGPLSACSRSSLLGAAPRLCPIFLFRGVLAAVIKSYRPSFLFLTHPARRAVWRFVILTSTPWRADFAIKPTEKRGRGKVALAFSIFEDPKGTVGLHSYSTFYLDVLLRHLDADALARTKGVERLHVTATALELRFEVCSGLSFQGAVHKIVQPGFHFFCYPASR